MHVEILRGRSPSDTGEVMLSAMERAILQTNDAVQKTTAYGGEAEVLILYGIGAPAHAAARDRHVARGGRVVHFDLGYLGRRKFTGYMRMSIDHDHPWRLMDATPNDAARWKAHGIRLRSDTDEAGPIVLVGLGRKSRTYLGLPNWERDKLVDLKARFPGREIVFRPKTNDGVRLPVRTDAETPIARLLRGASLVVCRHSNVAVDAVIAGVPFEAEDGAALWLHGKPYTKDNRADFMRRLSHWQYRPDEAGQAWEFAKRMMG